jgi:ATP-dependent Clp endopeptidase proteolytic subunit ClpP
MLADTRTAEVLLYGEIVPDSWRWSEADQSALSFDRQIREMRENGADKLHLRVNCPGGAVNEAVAMRSTIMNAGFEEMTATIEGICASAATVPVCVPGMHVRIVPCSEFMIHNPAGGVWGDAAEMEKGAERLRKLEDSVAKLYAERTGRDVDEIHDWMNAETWMTAEEAVDSGFADEVLAAEDDAAAKMSAQTMQVMMSAYKSVPKRLQMNICAEDEIGPGAEEADPAPADDNNLAAYEEDHGGRDEEENNEMDMTQMTAEQLRAGNPELYAAMMRDAAEAERARMQEIDEMTEPGYEQMAAEAKQTGKTPMEFYKQMVAAKKQKRDNYRTMRAEETKPADEVTGGDSGDNDPEQQYADEMEKYKAEMKAIGAQMRAGGDGYMF